MSVVRIDIVGQISITISRLLSNIALIQLNYIIRYLILYNSLHATDKYYEKFSIQTLIIIIKLYCYQ